MPSLLVIFFFDQAVVAGVTEKNQSSEYDSFRTVEEFLCSPLWARHRDTPRVLYFEKEIFHSVCNLETLSSLEKAFFWIQKKLFHTEASLYFLSRSQALFFHPSVPLSLKKGPLLKTTSLFLELLKNTTPQKTHPTLYYYFHPVLGLWQFALEKDLLFHHFTPSLRETQIENQLQKSLSHMQQMGIKNPIHSLNLSSLFSSPFPSHSLPYLKNISIHCSFNFFPSLLHATLAASILLLLGVAYNIRSLNTWETQLHLSRQALEHIKRKTNTPEYQRLKSHFRYQRGNDVTG